MESMSPPPAKKIRSINGVKMIQCKREFKLPVQFPSKASIKSVSTPKIKNGTNNAKDSRSILITNNVKKLRIRSQDGRDLGEIQVKFPTQELNTPLNSKIITLTKSALISNKNQKINKPVNSLVVPSKNMDRSTMVMQKPISPNKVFLATISQQSSDIESMDEKQTHQPLLLIKPINNFKESDGLQNKKMEKSIKTNMSNINTCLDPKEYRQLAKSKFPVVKCEKLTISKNKININELSALSLTKDNSTLNSLSIRGNKMVEKDNESSENSYNTINSNNIDHNVNTQKETINSEVPKIIGKCVYDKYQDEGKIGNNVVTTSNNKNMIIERDLNDARKKNCTSVPTVSKNIDRKSQNIFSNVSNSPIPCAIEKTSSNKNVENKEPNSKNCISSTNNVKEKESCIEEKLSQHWNIIKEALISVKDEELRAKALQALIDCGIGAAKHVPITPPENFKTIHDSLVQTDVFGLLEEDSFLLVKEDTSTLERIKQTERSTAVNLTTPIESNNTYLNCIDNDYLLPNLTLEPPMDDISDIDNFLNQSFNMNARVNKVKQILAPPHSLYKKVAMQVQEDFQMLQQWDDNGMLSIHRAVQNNNLREVQRLLVVLKASKINIDVLTANRMSCLELAIKFSASRGIVQVLLEAGAKPIPSELLHESAVILASKMSSALLPDLLKYVTDNKLLNQVDSAGFAPLHYCVLYGNLEGVNALIKAGAEINLKDNRSGRTPFFHALEHHRVSIAQKLLEYGAIANIPNYSGQSVLSLIDDAKSLSLKAALKQIII
ncbi:uncharacterized protein LOC122401240 [Colletes gigas]|uniref:uncharacterized protein LOC122401240 n=1 Tax=Colletes gigas TaxID=935657 RepID=UPI001C9A87C2|nr:uncharacterized protein LOC122401240 [Colletes gigas]